MLGVLLAATVLAAPPQEERGTFVALLGRDTVSVETYVRTPTELRVHAFTRIPETRIIDYTVSWDQTGALRGYEVINSAVPGTGGAARLRTVATVLGDSIEIVTTQGNAPARVRRTAAGPAIPLLTPAYALYETLSLRAQASRPSTMTMLPAAGPLLYTAIWRGDTLKLSHPQAGEIRMVLDARGRIRSYSGSETTFKVEVTPVSSADVDALAQSYARRPLGMLSPRDTARAKVGGATILIDYGRPSARGRVVFGLVVPWGAVWRTGANAATQLETTRDLTIGNVTIPAGKYSLWTIPRSNEWQLIVNKQTGQWGTAYDAAQDLARVPIRVQRVRDAAERFTIDIEPRGNGGVIRLTWENTQALIPFAVSRNPSGGEH